MYNERKMTYSIEEYDRRCNENVKACEKLLGKLGENDLMKIGVMIHWQLMAEKWYDRGTK